MFCTIKVFWSQEETADSQAEKIFPFLIGHRQEDLRLVVPSLKELFNLICIRIIPET